MKSPCLFRRLFLSAACSAVIGLFVACRLGCEPHPTAAGIEPEPDTSFIGRRRQVLLPAEEADMAVVFIGGFTESTLTHFRSSYETMPPLPCKGRQLRAFYDWESGTGNLLCHSTWRMQRDLRAFMQRNPQADIVLLGHSYGASAVMDVLRHLADVTEHGRIIVVTLDPVSRFAASAPRERAPQVDMWLNAYCDPYRALADAVPLMGGAWRNCPSADVNLNYPGTARDAAGHRFQHRYPRPLLMEPAPQRQESPYDLLCDYCRRAKAGDRPQNVN